MKILLFGKNGQVGRELERSLAPLGQLLALDRNTANLENPAQIGAVLQQHTPDIIVNAAAYTAVDQAESNEACAQKINADAVKVMADHARTHNALLVHYSTDYVFDGEKNTPYTEQDATNPLNAYGRSKRAGEIAIMDSGCPALILRTSWVFSAHGNNFVKTIIRLAQERENLSIVADQVGAPTSAKLIADLTALAIVAWQKHTLPVGLYHLTASGATSWYGLAMHIVERLQTRGLTLRLQPSHISPIATQNYPMPAKRPTNSQLNTGTLSAALGINISPWMIDVNQVIDQLVQTKP